MTQLYTLNVDCYVLNYKLDRLGCFCNLSNHPQYVEEVEER